MSEPDENGYRLLEFEVNGSMREVKILDRNLEVKADHRIKADKSNPGHLGSTIPGTVGKVLVKEGDPVTVNMPLLTVEAMKMETTAYPKLTERWIRSTLMKANRSIRKICLYLLKSKKNNLTHNDRQ